MPLELALGKPHEEAAALIAGKAPVVRAVFDQLLPELRGRAFTITGIEDANVLQAVRDALAELPRGSVWQDVQADVVAAIEPYLGDGAEKRAELLLRTHGFQAFQAANWNVAQADTDTTHLQYLATEDDHVRDTHLALNGIILPKDDPFWAAHFPPWEWGCRCRTRPINPDLLADAKADDATRNPDDQLVIEGPALAQLRNGTLIRDGQRFDVTSPADQREGSGFSFSPDDLRIPLADLQQRYDAPVWNEFLTLARATEVEPGVSLLEWLSGAEIKTPAPASAPVASARVPQGKPVSEAIQNKVRSLNSRKGVQEALRAIDTIHGDGLLPSLIWKQETRPGTNAALVSRMNPLTRELTAHHLFISQKAGWPALSAAHEIGHLLDLEGIGAKGQFATVGQTHLVKEVMEAIKASDAYAELAKAGRAATSFRRRLFIEDYLLDPVELWARAYAQFIASRSASAQLTRELETVIAALPGGLPIQWAPADFAGIGRAFEALFFKLGWMKSV